MIKSLKIKSDVWLFLVVLFTGFYFFQGGFANQNTRFDLVLSLIFENKISIDSWHTNTIDKVFVNGHYFAEKAPGTSYLALWVPFLAKYVFQFNALSANSTSLDLLLYFSTCLSVTLITALAVVLFSKILLILNPDLDYSHSLVISFLLYIGTLSLPYSTVLMSHQLTASLLTIGFYFLLKARERNSLPHIFGSGICFAFSVLCEYPTVAIVVPLMLSFLYRQKKPNIILIFFLSALPFVLLLLSHNYFSFGNPFTLGYGKLQGTSFEDQMSKGFFGVTLPSFAALLQLLFGSYRGFFFYSPILICGVAAFIYWPREKFRHYAFTALVGSFLLLLINSSYRYWQGGACFGPRHLVAAIPFIGLGFAFVPKNWLRNPLFILLVMISIFINLLGTSTTLFPDEYDFNPLFQSYATYLKYSLVSLNPMGFNTSTEEFAHRLQFFTNYPDVSFNLGEKMGLNGFSSLIPLLFVWCIFIFAILKFAKRGRELKC